MSGFFDKVKSGAGKVAFEADKVADAKKVELDIANVKKSIDGQYTRLGAMSYQVPRYELSDPRVRRYLQRHRSYRAEIVAKQEELKAINARQWQPPAAPQQQHQAPPTSYAPPPQQYSAPPPTPPPAQGGRVCPSCGQPVSDTTKFCSNCGAKVA